MERPKRKSAVFSASNGLLIMNSGLWQELEGTLRPWVRMGPVAYADDPGRATDELVWVMPMECTGPYARTVVKRLCEVCGRPTHAHLGDPQDELLRTILTVTSVPEAYTPVALVGMWHGQFQRGRPAGVGWDVLFAGDLYDRLLKKKIRGFVPAERPIQTQSEVNEVLSH